MAEGPRGGLSGEDEGVGKLTALSLCLSSALGFAAVLDANLVGVGMGGDSDRLSCSLALYKEVTISRWKCFECTESPSYT